jgi:hypothetical protein
VTIFFKTRDCSLGLHWGYAYIDGLCGSNEPMADFTLPALFCDNGSGLVVDGSNSILEDSYQWSICETDASGSTDVLSTLGSEWFYGQHAGVFNLQPWYEAKGHRFECGKFYKITLKVTNECGKSDMVSKVIQFYCPKIIAAPDHQICCKQGQSVTIGLTTSPLLYYSWTSTPAGFASYLPQPVVSPNSTTNYQLVVSDINGCKSYDDVNVIVLQPFKTNIHYDCLQNFNPAGVMVGSTFTQPPPIPCDGLLTANIDYMDCFPANSALQALNNSAITYQWSTGETTKTITPHPGISSYTVTISNGCHTATTSIDEVIPGGYFAQAIPSIGAPSGILPNGTTAQQVCKFFEYGPSAPLLGTGPAYHAYRYRLRIFDRWGNIIRYIDDVNPCGFKNGEIEWDARSNAGNLVPEGVYTAQLTLWNCNTPVSGNMNFPVLRGRKLVCVSQHWSLLAFGWVCDEYEWQDIYESASTCSITVVY